MTVVDSKTLECTRKTRGIFNHIVPEPRVVFGTGTVPKLDAITPNDDLSAEVCLGGWHCEVFEGVRVPYPPVVG